MNQIEALAPGVLCVSTYVPCVQIMHLDTAATDWQKAGLEPHSLLSPHEHERLNGIKLPATARQWMHSRALLRIRLGEILRLAPESICFETNTHGKPRLSAELSAAVGPFWFNYTHSGEYAALAYSRLGEVGIDLEECRAIKRLDQKAKLFLTQAEQNALFAQPEPERDNHFLRIWVFKESLAKAMGGGLQNRTRSLDVSQWMWNRLPAGMWNRLPACESLLSEEPNSDFVPDHSWQLQELSLPGYVGAVAWSLSQPTV